MPTKLEQKQTELSEKSKRLAEVFEKAGADLDFSKDDVLKLVDAKDSKGAVDRVQEWNRELEDLGKEVDGLAKLADIDKKNKDRLDQPAGGIQHPEPGGGKSGGDDPPASFKSLGQIVTESAPYKAYRETGQPTKGVGDPAFGLREMKTLFQTSAGWAPESVRIPGLVIDKATRPIQILDIIPDGRTTQAAVVYMEETTRTHAAAERAEAAAYAEDAFALTEQSSTVRSIGSSIPVTDEQLEDVAQVESYLNQRMSFGLRQRLDNQVLNGNGTPPNLTGILNASGIQTQAKGTDPVPDAVYKAMTKVRVTGRAFPNAFVAHPNDWQDIRLLRTADGIYIWGSPSEAGPERIWGIQVVQSDAIAENTGLVGDFMNFCQLYERRGMEILVGFVNDDFLKGKRTLRAGFRVAFVVYRAAAFATVTGI